MPTRSQRDQETLDDVLVLQTVLYRQPLWHTTLKTSLGIPALSADDVGYSGTLLQRRAARRDAEMCNQDGQFQMGEEGVSGVFWGDGPGTAGLKKPRERRQYDVTTCA
jgi:hypothetical protein